MTDDFRPIVSVTGSIASLACGHRLKVTASARVGEYKRCPQCERRSTVKGLGLYAAKSSPANLLAASRRSHHG